MAKDAVDTPTIVKNKGFLRGDWKKKGHFRYRVVDTEEDCKSFFYRGYRGEYVRSNLSTPSGVCIDSSIYVWSVATPWGGCPTFRWDCTWYRQGRNGIRLEVTPEVLILVASVQSPRITRWNRNNDLQSKKVSRFHFYKYRLK